MNSTGNGFDDQAQTTIQCNDHASLRFWDLTLLSSGLPVYCGFEIEDRQGVKLQSKQGLKYKYVYAHFVVCVPRYV